MLFHKVDRSLSSKVPLYRCWSPIQINKNQPITDEIPQGRIPIDQVFDPRTHWYHGLCLFSYHQVQPGLSVVGDRSLIVRGGGGVQNGTRGGG